MRSLGTRLGKPALLACALALAACGKSRSKGPADPTATLIDHRSETSPDTSITALIGVYGEGCADPLGEWSLSLGVATQALGDYRPLVVDQDDDDCILSIVAVTTVDGHVLSAETPIVLDGSYLDEPVGFGMPPVFFGNAKIDLSSGRAPDLFFVFSDQKELAFDEPVSVAFQNESVPAPDYVVDLSNLTIQTDAANLVEASFGFITLRPNQTPGEGYALVRGRLDSYDELDRAYQQSRPIQTHLAAAELELLGTDLDTPQVRTLIVANVVDGIRSYQAFALTFRPGA